eukprot:PhM_4_TR14436/c0_g1_i1/m.76846/K01772/hemH, FECH; protoporphyrin/coproporphyrin ferrochelatase
MMFSETGAPKGSSIALAAALSIGAAYYAWSWLRHPHNPKWVPNPCIEKRPSHGVLLVNLGTPDDLSTGAVRRYLRQFLMDGRVIDIAFWKRWVLVNLIIAPFRAPTSAASYRELWSHFGGESPLKKFGVGLQEAVQKKLGDDTLVVLGMRYQNPSVHHALRQLQDCGVSHITVLPLFPQYASSSTGSAIQEVMEHLSQWNTIPSTHIISQFVTEPGYIKAVNAVVAPLVTRKEGWDMIVMSFHGIPYNHVEVSCPYCRKREDRCTVELNAANQLCYRALCYATARRLAASFSLGPNDYKVMFQSRFGKAEWLQPYATDVVPSLPRDGKKRVLTLPLSFVADCLETTMEVGDEFKIDFMNAGGEEWVLAPSLNMEQPWIDCVCQMVTANTPAPPKF